jgi:hypothetical protein
MTMHLSLHFHPIHLLIVTVHRSLFFLPLHPLSMFHPLVCMDHIAIHLLKAMQETPSWVILYR